MRFLLAFPILLIGGCQFDQFTTVKTVSQFEVRFHNLMIEDRGGGGNLYPYPLPYGVRLGTAVYYKPLGYNKTTDWIRLPTGVYDLELGGPNDTWTTGQGNTIDSRSWLNKKIVIVLLGTPNYSYYELK